MSDDIPDYHGFNTKLIRDSGQSLKPKTKLSFHPLLDKTPSDPSTILTAMVDAERITNRSGQEITIFTADQQLYRVAIDITLSDPDRWRFFIPRIGGMHCLVSFVECVGVLMENTGLVPLMKCAFSGVDNMLKGKKFPMNIRALRFVVLELFRCHLDGVNCYEDLTSLLEQLNNGSLT